MRTAHPHTVLEERLEGGRERKEGEREGGEEGRREGGRRGRKEREGGEGGEGGRRGREEREGTN